MKNFKIIIGILVTTLMSSCLTMGLEDLPVYSDADITNFKFEYRWAAKEGTSDVLRVKVLNVDLDVNKDKKEVTCSITVPPADSQFSADIREKVSLNNLIGYSSISTAATIHPLGNSPALGKPGDFSISDMQYEVVAADRKTKQIWKLIIKSFDK